MGSGVNTDLDIYSLELRRPTGDYEGRLLDNATAIELESSYTATLNWGVLFQFGFHLLQALTVCMCLCKMLHVVMETLFARQVRVRLRVRVPNRVPKEHASRVGEACAPS